MLPIKLMTKIRMPPKIEFPINFPIAFNGIEKNFPSSHKPITQPIIIKILEMSKFYHLPFHTYDRIWTNMTYPTRFFLKYNSSIISNEIPRFFALFTKKSSLLLLALI